MNPVRLIRRSAALLALWLASVTALAQAQFGAGPLAVERRNDSVVAAYVPGWASPALVDGIRPGSVSHLLFAFLRLCGPGQLPADEQACAGKADYSLADDPAQQRFDAAFQRLKQREPQLKVLASVGGWGGSDPFFSLAASTAGRAAFVDAALGFLRQHGGFDGIDIDWEHPGDNGAANGVQLGSPSDGAHYLALLQDLRAGLDRLSAQTGRRYLLSVAISPAAKIVARLDWGQAHRPLDYVFMMSYDHYGGWSERLGHHSALRSSAARADDGLDEGVANFLRAGVPAGKLVAGVAMYGRGFSGAAAPHAGAAKSGVYPGGGDGSLPYRELAARYLDASGRGRAGFHSRRDQRMQAWYLYDPRRRLYIGYDDPRAVEAKARFARGQGLAGVFAWELSQDNGDLLNAMNRGSGHRLLGAPGRER